MTHLNTPSATTQANSSYRPELDGLRALAVIAVIINHFNKNILPSGYLGVDIFFVISGYVITSSLAGRPSPNISHFLLNFYTRRIKRLLPALILFVVINCLLIAILSPYPQTSLKTGLASLFGLSNLYLWRKSTDYFAGATELNVFTHTWSLGVEEQFYMLFPLITWFTGFSRLTIKGPRNLLITIGLLSTFSLLSFIYLYQTNQPAAYFLMPTRLWELGSGCLIFLITQDSHKSGWVHTLTNLPPLLVLAALLIILFIPLQFAIFTTIAVVLLTAILIVCLRPETAPYKLFTYKYVVYIGLVSYSLYLWHWSVLSLSRWTIGVSGWTIPFQLALMVVCCLASYKYVETPLRWSAWSPSLPKTLGYGLSASISAGLFIALLYPNTASFTLVDANKEMSYKTHWEEWQDCDYVKSDEPQEGGCKYLPNQNNPLRLVVIGDSHAGHLASGLKEILPSLPSSIAVALYAGCYPTIDSPCYLTQNAFEWVLNDPQIEVVVLAAYHNLVIHKNRLYMSAENPNVITEDALLKLEAELGKTVNLLTSAGKQVVMIVDSHELLLNPELEVNPMTQLVRKPGLLNVSHESVIARNQSYYHLLDKMAADNPNFTVFYSGTVFCHNNICQSDINGQPLFQSEDHLTPFGSKLIASQYQPFLKTLLDK